MKPLPETQRFCVRIANSLACTIKFISSDLIIRRAAWPWADEAIEKAVAINPDAGEVHLAQANHLYCAYLDYDRPGENLQSRASLFPNEPRCFELAGYMERRSGNGKQLRRTFKGVGVGSSKH